MKNMTESLVATILSNFCVDNERSSIASLPDDLLLVILDKLSIKDRISFSSVCHSWQSTCNEITKKLRQTNQLPFLMLPTELDDNQTCSMYSLKDDKLSDLHVPVVHNRVSVGSSFGWVVNVAIASSTIASEDEVYSIRLLNPIFQNEIRLPPLTAFNIEGDPPHDSFIHKAVISEDPLSNSSYVVITIFGQYCRLAFYRPGGAWTPLSDISDKEFYCMDDVVYYKQQFYAVNYLGQVFICDLNDCSRPTISRMAHSPPSHSFKCDVKMYLVESASTGDLLKVAKLIDWKDEVPNSAYTSGFHVFKLAADEKEWIEIHTLQGCILFIGKNSSVSLFASNYAGCKPNTIYFTDDLDGCGLDGNVPRDMGVYDFEDGMVSPHYPLLCIKDVPAPIWVHSPLIYIS